MILHKAITSGEPVDTVDYSVLDTKRLLKTQHSGQVKVAAGSSFSSPLCGRGWVSKDVLSFGCSRYASHSHLASHQLSGQIWKYPSPQGSCPDT